ncbi:hypothetical protein NL676_038848 [Syzygium grande]|nr:hypothetical protein NL676_038848 [Syzygium grande]
MGELRNIELGSSWDRASVRWTRQRTGVNAGLEEEIEGEEVGIGHITGHEVEVGCCSAEVASIELGDRAAVEGEGERFRGKEKA